MGGSPRDRDPHREDAFGRHTDVHVGGLPCDREVSDESGPHQAVPPAVRLLLGLLVGNDAQSHPHAVGLAKVGERQ